MKSVVQVIIEVGEEEAKLLKNEKMIEIVRRDKQKRYKAFIDGAIKNLKESEVKKANDILQPAVKTLGKRDIDKAVHVMKNVSDHIKVTDGVVKHVSKELADLSLDFKQIFNSVGVVKAMSFLNVALSGLNLIATVAGFVIIGNMLNDLDRKIQNIDKRVAKIQDNELHKIYEEYHKLVMRFNSLATKLKDHDEVSRDDLENYLTDANAFIQERLIKSVEKCTFDANELLTMINTLLPSYTLILIEFEKSYYFDKHKQHGNERTFMNLYKSLQSDSFLSSIHDYLFLTGDMHANDALIAVTIQKILVNEQLIEIYVQNLLMKEMETKDRYIQLENAMNKSIKEYAANLVKYREDTEETDYSEIFPAINKAYQMLQPTA